MARKPAQKTALKNAKTSPAFRPALITLAIALGWGALNEPAGFTMATMSAWLLTMGAVALVAHAALVLGAPLVRLLAGQCQAAIQQLRTEQKP